MSDPETAFVTLGADVGGKDAHCATQAHILAFRRVLAAACRARGSYGTRIREIALVLRIDGSVQAWMKRGVEDVALQKRNAFATADIYIPADVWSDGSDFRRFLASQATLAIGQVIELARSKGVALSSDILRRDVAIAVDDFLEA